MTHSVVPHLRIPLSVGRSGGFETFEQDTPDEVTQCVAVLLSTIEGQRIELPTYGIPDPMFRVTMPIHEIESRITEWEPRAATLIEEQPTLIEELARTVGVVVEVG